MGKSSSHRQHCVAVLSSFSVGSAWLFLAFSFSVMYFKTYVLFSSPWRCWPYLYCFVLPFALSSAPGKTHRKTYIHAYSTWVDKILTTSDNCTDDVFVVQVLRPYFHSLLCDSSCFRTFIGGKHGTSPLVSVCIYSMSTVSSGHYWNF